MNSYESGFPTLYTGQNKPDGGHTTQVSGRQPREHISRDTYGKQRFLLYLCGVSISTCIAYAYADMEMRAEIAMDENDELHRRVKAYADEHGLKHPRAYAELIEAGLEQEGDGT